MVRRHPIKATTEEQSAPLSALARPLSPRAPTRRAPTLPLPARVAFVLFAVVALCGCVVEPGAIAEPSQRAGVGSIDATASPAPLPTASARTASPAPSEAILVAAGKSTATTASFRVDDSWMLGWQHSGRALFTIQLIPANVDTYGDLALSIVGPAKGTEPMYRAGSFVLRVVATGTWQVTVVDVGARALERLPFTVTGSGTSNSPMFWIDGAWFVEWSQRGSSPFHISLVSVAGDGSWALADSSSAAGSCAAPGRAGRFYLHVVAVGSWRLTLSSWDGTELVCPI